MDFIRNNGFYNEDDAISPRTKRFLEDLEAQRFAPTAITEDSIRSVGEFSGNPLDEETLNVANLQQSFTSPSNLFGFFFNDDSVSQEVSGCMTGPNQAVESVSRFPFVRRVASGHVDN